MTPNPHWKGVGETFMGREIYYREALCEALRDALKKDKKTFLIGLDIGEYGGAFAVTKGLLDEFGKDRVINAPISENSMVGVGVGAALTGMKPIVEIMFMDFVTLAMDQIVNHMAKLSYIYGGQVSIPMVIRTPAGAGRGYGASHSQSLESWFMHVPGLKVVAPSNAYDAKGLLAQSIIDKNPVMFIENKMLYGMKGEVPKENYTVPIGKAEVKREGKDVTIVSYSRMVWTAMEAAGELAREGIEAEVIDLRTLAPMDFEAVSSSVSKTGKMVIVEEDCLTGGVGAEVAAKVCEDREVFEALESPIKRVACADVPIPCSSCLESWALPDKGKVVKAVKDILYE